MSRIIRLRDGSSLDLLGLGVLAVVLATIALGVVIILPTWTMYRNPPAAPTATRDSAASAKKHSDAVAWQRQQVAGRSMFYKPAPPDQKEDTTVAKYYGGPTLLAYVNGTAWFSDGQKVSAKEPEGKTVRFLSAKPPWSVRVRWEGGEFDVKLFDRTEFSSLSSASALSAANLGGFSSTLPAPKAGSAAVESKPNFPPEARMGPGAGQPSTTPAGGGGSDAPQPPPGGGGPAGGQGGPGGPAGTPPSEPGQPPQPAPPPAPPSPQPTPGILTGVPLVQPSPDAPKEQGVTPEPSKPSHP